LWLAFVVVTVGKAGTLDISQYPGTTVGEYNGASGAPVNTNFIGGLDAPTQMALSGDVLFVANYGNGTIGEYNATTGAAINPSFITGINGATGIAVSGNNLYVSNQTSSSSSPMFIPGTVSEYDATTGAAINASFITGLSSPERLAALGNTLFVVNGDVGTNIDTIGTYNATTGAAINARFLPLFDPTGLVIAGNTLFVSNYDASVAGGGTVGEYNATTGAVINANFITGLNGPEGIVISGNDLFVANYLGGTVGEYNATTGAVINADFITISDPWDFAVSAGSSIPEPSTWLFAIGGVVILGVMIKRKQCNRFGADLRK